VARSIQTAAVASMQWSCVECGSGGGGGSVDTDGGSGVDAVELTSLLAATAVDWSTEMAAVASMQWS
jgi:hypothetical protein